MTSLGKWTPRVPILPKNNIISSDFTNTRPFVPDYETEPEDMQKIMSNSYAKTWHREKIIFKKRIQQEKEENSVFLMRRYVIKGLNKRLRDLESLKAVPSRVKVGTTVPYAVRLRPKENSSEPPSPESAISQKSKIRPKPEPKVGLHVSIEEAGKPQCAIETVDGRLAITANVGPASKEMKELESKCDHVHVEQKGDEFVVHRVACKENHHHGCDCTEFEDDQPC